MMILDSGLLFGPPWITINLLTQ